MLQNPQDRHRRRRGRGTALGLAALATSFLSVGGAVAASPSASSGGPVHDVSNTPGMAEGEESIAVNPTDSNDIIVGSNQWQPWTQATSMQYTGTGPSGLGLCAVWSSHDGGTTWSGGTISEDGVGPLSAAKLAALRARPVVRGAPPEFRDPGNIFAGDQNVVFDRHGTAYLECMEFGTRTGTIIVDVRRSHDGGRTWAAPVRALVVDDPLIQIDRPWLAVDDTGGPRDGTIYLVWETIAYQAWLPAVYERNSTDGGRTWGPIVRVDDSGSRAMWDPRNEPAIGADGTLYIVYDSAIYVSPDPLEPQYTPISLVVARSADGGRTFQKTIAEPNVRRTQDPDEEEVYFQETISGFAADPLRPGRIAVAWPDTREGPARILLRDSVDGGRTWSGIQDISDDPVGNGNNHDHVALTYLPDGRVMAVWRDRRCCGGSFKDPFGNSWELFARAVDIGEDGTITPGATLLVSTAVQPPTTNAHGGFMPSGYVGVTAGREGLSVSWDEMRGTWPDNVYRRIPLDAFGPPRSAPRRQPGSLSPQSTAAVNAVPNTGAGTVRISLPAVMVIVAGLWWLRRRRSAATDRAHG